MKLTVFGASGRIGGEVVRQGRAGGHDVTAVVRRGGDTARLRDDAEVVEVDGIDDPDTLHTAVTGRDAIISGLGPRALKDAGIAAPMTRTILDTMDRTDVRRILVVSAAPVGAPHPDDSFTTRRILMPVVSRLLTPVYDDLREMEDDLALSGLEWTAVRPPRLVDRDVTGVYRMAVEENLPLGPKISRADVAHAMLAMVDDRSTVGHAVGVAW